MKEQLVSFETAKLAKEKGFNEPCSHYYVLNFRNFKTDGVLHKVGLPDEYDSPNIYQFVKRGSGQPHLAGAPTQSLLQKWLREHHKAHIIIEPRYDKENCTLTGKVDYYCWRGFVHTYPSTVGGVENTYEEALEKGLKTLMIAIKTKDPRVMHYRNRLLEISPYRPL